ncbi:MAG: DUF3078 domain-containing protein [bacterium]|nr:DUF3078 domain-containing protein [bacterium]
MKSIKWLIFLGFFSTNILAQNATDSTQTEEEVNPWTKSWVFSLTGNQAEYNNWSRGGVNSTAFTASTLFRAKYTGSEYSNTTRVNLRFGQINQEGQGVEKTEDMIRISNKTDYFLTTTVWSAFAEIAFRTQFTKGFDEETGEIISDFMSPGYITESLGISYQPVDYFSTQLGVGLKQTFVQTDGLDQFYGLGEDEDIRSEGGITFALDYKKEIFKNFTYETELSTFTNLLIPITSTDVIMTNIFTGKINNFMTSSLEMSFIYDDDFSDRLQTMRIISLGIQIQIL